jgi:pimeloyl-ACP methyl ester carboxylesterase
MWLLGKRLRDQGYDVTAVDYPSMSAPIAEQVVDLQRELERCCLDGPGRLHFVTHSMGGILVRALIARERPPNLGRVVMLSPPNKGTELADALAGNWLVDLMLGPAVGELGTSPESFPNQLPAPDFELGVIAAVRAWNLIGSAIIPGPDDGTVPIESMKIDGMADFRTVPATHTFIMNDPEVALETAYFLEHGRFRPETAAVREQDLRPRTPALGEAPLATVEPQSRNWPSDDMDSNPEGHDA